MAGKTLAERVAEAKAAKQAALVAAKKEETRQRMLAISLEEGFTEEEFNAQFEELYVEIVRIRVVNRMIDESESDEEEQPRAKLSSKFPLNL